MDTFSFLPDELKKATVAAGSALCEIRLRRDRPVVFTLVSGKEISHNPLSQESFSKIASCIMGHSLYARENELSNGFVSLKNGFRAGISGQFTGTNRQISDLNSINSICLRFAREIKGCADGIMEQARNAEGLLIVSPPGMGKTTLLRDIVRQLSDEGKNISLMDERGEIAACISGTPQLDTGKRTDIYSMCPKAEGIMMAIRSMSPDIIAADEIGKPEDATALLEAARCGVKIIATCHGKSLESLRPCISVLIRKGIFDTGVLLGPSRGKIIEIKHFDGGNL